MSSYAVHYAIYVLLRSLSHVRPIAQRKLLIFKKSKIDSGWKTATLITKYEKRQSVWGSLLS